MFFIHWLVDTAHVAAVVGAIVALGYGLNRGLEHAMARGDR